MTRQNPPSIEGLFHSRDAAVAASQARPFAGVAEAALLLAITDALEELGYMLGPSQSALGVITASRTREAPPRFWGIIGPAKPSCTDRVTIVTRAAGRAAQSWRVQTSWQRIHFHSATGQVIRSADLDDAAPAQELFAAIDKSLSRSSGAP